MSETKSKKGKGGAGNPAFMKPHKLDKHLEAVVGKGPMSRPQIVKKIWAYIKENDLQDGRNIKADDKLKKVFDGEKSVTMFELQKKISAHLIKD